MVERAYRQLKDDLHSRLAADKWVLRLSTVLLGLGSAPKDNNNVQRLFGRAGVWVLHDGAVTVSQHSRATVGDVLGRPESFATSTHQATVLSGGHRIFFPGLSGGNFFIY